MGGEEKESERNTLQSLFEKRDVEIDEQASTATCKAQIGQKLGLMHGQQNVHTFQFDDKLFDDQQVDPETAVQCVTFVVDGQFQLSSKRNTGCGEFVRQAVLVSGFQQTRSQYAMHLQGAPNDLGSQRIKRLFLDF